MVSTVTTDTIQWQIQEHEDELTRVRGQLDQIRAEEDELLVAQGLGQRVDTRRLEQLGHDGAALERKERQTARIVAGLKDRAHAEHATGRQRQYEADATALTALSARAPEIERAYLEALEALVSIAGELLAVQAAYDAAWLRYQRYQHEHHLPPVPLRRPCSPLVVPEQYLRRVAPYVPLEQWLREETAARRFGQAGK